MMDYTPQASSVPATLYFFFLFGARNTKERLASGNTRAVKCKSVCKCHSVFVLHEQMDVDGEAKANFFPPNERANETKHFSFYLQAFIFDTSISAIFVNVTFSLPVAMQHANN